MAPGSRPSTSSTLKEKQDESIMGTNNSCIVSKRSVEKIYHKNDYGFLRSFIKKFQRRSPLINRGYWLRMNAIEDEVLKFLAKDCPKKKKAVINLGCGYDTLSFKVLADKSDSCSDVVFVDVDYPELISKKCEIVRTTSSICKVIGTFAEDEADLALRSKHYCAIACDLENLGTLSSSLNRVFEAEETTVLFIAEVSMTYMDIGAANAIIKYSATFPHAIFCLLEQFLPEGTDHPFAQTMLKHFHKLQSPLKSALEYRSLASQKKRFVDLNWHAVSARTLWDIWGDNELLTPKERADLDLIEPFDEWEEFSLFASHYFLLTATSKSFGRNINNGDPVKDSLGFSESMYITFATHERGEGRRRSGALWKISNSRVVHHGGQGVQGRLSDVDTYISGEVITTEASLKASSPPTELMCHTISDLNGSEALLVGGRTSPERVSSACLLWQDGEWKREEHLPHGLYRHCAVTVSDVQSEIPRFGVLVFGGKTGSGKVTDDWLLWEPMRGWKKLEVSPDRPSPRFGACMATSYDSTVHGFVTGGLSQDGKVYNDIWEWNLSAAADGNLYVDCALRSSDTQGQMKQFRIGRYGAQLVSLSNGFLLIGGIQEAEIVPRELEVLFISPSIVCKPVQLVGDVPRPLLVGVRAIRTKGNSVLVVGGGAICFSFGSYWNDGSYLIATYSLIESPWSLDNGKSNTGMRTVSKSPSKASDARPPIFGRMSSTLEPAIPRVHLRDLSEKGNALWRDSPIVFESVELGACTNSWTVEYLTRAVGAERRVVVHVAQTSKMDFLSKNFSYATKTFKEFLDEVENGAKMYLRSLSSASPADKPANLEVDFPSIAPDFQLPPELSDATKTAHSSILRVSGPVAMWLHYDVMANVLCQVRGRKRLVLYPPSEIRSLQLPPGASSSPLNAFEQDDTSPLKAAKAYRVTLNPGDVLFIPPLWAHAAEPTDGMSIAVNVFFRNLTQGYAAGKDIYGNRDLQAYENGRKDIQKIKKSFQGLPTDAGRFYLLRLAAELSEIAESYEQGNS